MAINNKLSSYLAMANFLKEKGYTDDEINKVNNGIVGENGQGTIDANYFSNYTKLSEDDKVLGKSFLQNYINDVQADETYKNQVNLANNQARQDTAYNDYVNRRLASYLGEIEAANGQTGYTGLTEGNRIAMANNQINAQNTISNTQQSALQKALSDYNNQLITNANTADNTYTTNKSAIDEKNDTNYQNAIGELSSYLQKDGIKQTDSNGNPYIKDTDKEKVKELIKENYGIDIDTDKKAQSYINAYLNWYNNGKTEENIEKDKEVSATNEKLESRKSSGGISAGNTATIKVKDSNGNLTNDNVTVTFSSSSHTIRDRDWMETDTTYKNAEAGQVFIVNGSVYVKSSNNRLYRVVNYEGEGAYERLLNMYQNTKFNLGSK